MTRRRIAALAALLLAAAALCGWNRAAFFAAWLCAWWWALGVVMGALPSVWIHSLSGGAWGEALRPPLLRLALAMPLLALLALPLAWSLDTLYPWARGDAWSEGLSSPAFKLWWLRPQAVLLRGALFLLLWTALALLSQRSSLQRSRAFAAFALMAYAVSTSLAAVDWLMSLMPRFYSAGFGLALLMGQGLAGLSAALLLYRGTAAPALLRDFGNLLIAWLLMWAYLAFMQMQIIWAENLPHEIAWYLPRLQGAWQPLAWTLLLAGFALPLLLLLSRDFKQNPRRLRALAFGLVLMHGLDIVWLTLPSLDAAPPASAAAAENGDG